MRTHISSLQKDFFKHWKGYSKAPFPKDFENEQIDMIMEQAMKRSDRYLKLKVAGKSKKEIKKTFRKKVPMTVFSWKEKEIPSCLQ